MGRHEDQASVTNALGSVTTSMGMALGEILLLTDRSEELLEHLREIHITARATLMSSDVRPLGTIRRPEVSLSVAALGVVAAWHEAQDTAALGNAVVLLEEVLEEMGVLYVPHAPEKDSS